MIVLMILRDVKVAGSPRPEIMYTLTRIDSFSQQIEDTTEKAGKAGLLDSLLPGCLCILKKKI